MSAKLFPCWQGILELTAVGVTRAVPHRQAALIFSILLVLSGIAQATRISIPPPEGVIERSSIVAIGRLLAEGDRVFFVASEVLKGAVNPGDRLVYYGIKEAAPIVWVGTTKGEEQILFGGIINGGIVLTTNPGSLWPATLTYMKSPEKKGEPKSEWRSVAAMPFSEQRKLVIATIAEQAQSGSGPPQPDGSGPGLPKSAAETGNPSPAPGGDAQPAKPGDGPDAGVLPAPHDEPGPEIPAVPSPVESAPGTRIWLLLVGGAVLAGLAIRAFWKRK